MSRTTRAALAALTLVACAGEHAPEASSAPSPTEPVPIECQTPPPALASYDAISADAPFSLVIMRDEHDAWIPRVPLRMPMHHASMISWTDAQHLLDAHRSREPVLVFATGLGRTSIDHDEEHNVFFATYGARIDRVCPAPD